MSLLPLVVSMASLFLQPGQQVSTATKTQEPAAKVKVDRETLLKEFQETLTNAVMVGQYTASPKGSTDLPEVKADRYTITKVLRGEGDGWIIFARVQYGEKDVETPVPVEVKWAGDTPVITLTNFMVPFLGTYSTRLVIYKDRYAGTWSGLTQEGHLWGRIEKAKPQEDAAKKDTAKKDTDTDDN